jgi:hypothetical protein
MTDFVLKMRDLDVIPHKHIITLNSNYVIIQYTSPLQVLLYGNETWTIKARNARRITAAEMKYMRRTAGYTWTDLQNKYTNCKEIKNNTNFEQITGVQEKMDTTCT